MYSFIRPLLFQLDPEQAHDLTVNLLGWVGRSPALRSLLRRLYGSTQSSPVKLFGLTFPNRVGLAAGYDKDGLAIPGLTALGFGHLEIGTVTPQPQEGNPCPRIFRIPREGALINRMGFPGRGADFLAKQLARYRGQERLFPELVLGVNIGKNKDTPNKKAVEDYLFLLKKFAPLADYLALNVSSPNTVGLRRLQGKRELKGLLNEVTAEREKQAQLLEKPLPLLVKLAPDLSDGELYDALEVVLATGLEGVIATNTTVSRKGISSPLKKESGGLSGVPLRKRSTEMITKIAQFTEGRLPIIGVGGVDSPAAAREKLEAGASLVQVYTGMVYRGPGLVKEIVAGLPHTQS